MLFCELWSTSFFLNSFERHKTCIKRDHIQMFYFKILVSVSLFVLSLLADQTQQQQSVIATGVAFDSFSESLFVPFFVL